MLLPILATIAVLLLPLLALIVLYNAARNKQQATFVPRNYYEIVEAGEEPIKFFYNSGDDNEYYDPAADRVKTVATEEDRTERNRLRKTEFNLVTWWLWKKWGFRWVSLVVPARRLRKNRIKRVKVRKQTDSTGNSIVEMLEEEPDITTESVLIEFPRPAAITEAEDKDRFQVDVLVNATFKVKRLLVWAIVRKLDFDLLMDVVRGAVIDFIRTKQFAEFLALGKGKGSKDFSQVIISMIGANLEETMGVSLTDVWVISVKVDNEALGALRAGKLLELQAKADYEKAKIDRQAAEEKAIGDAAPVSELGKAYARIGPMAGFVNAERIMEKLPKNLQTLVNGGGVIPTIPLNGAGQPPNNGAPSDPPPADKPAS